MDDPRIDRVLIDRQAIADRVTAMAEQITADLAEAAEPNTPAEITIVAVMTGSLIFLADLVRRMPIHIRIELITVRSYPGKSTTSQGPQLEGRLPDNLSNAHLLVVEDILDSGQTIQLVRRLMQDRSPRWLRFATLLRKDRPEAMDVPVDYVGFDIPDEFVVGYGLDHDGYWRNHPDVVTLDPEALA